MKKNIRLSEDQQLAEKVKARIRWDIRVSNSDLNVTVEDGCVFLQGFFDESYRHSAAVEIISTTEGVKQLIDRSEVKFNFTRDDRQIETLVTRQILELPFQPGEWIDVEVADGTVTLSGVVHRPWLKAMAARASWELSGVKDCKNVVLITDGLEQASKFKSLFRRGSVEIGTMFQRGVASGT